MACRARTHKLDDCQSTAYKTPYEIYQEHVCNLGIYCRYSMIVWSFMRQFHINLLTSVNLLDVMLFFFCFLFFCWMHKIAPLWTFKM